MIGHEESRLPTLFALRFAAVRQTLLLSHAQDRLLFRLRGHGFLRAPKLLTDLAGKLTGRASEFWRSHGCSITVAPRGRPAGTIHASKAGPGAGRGLINC